MNWEKVAPLIRLLIELKKNIFLCIIIGCRASALNLEAKSLYTWQTSRHCIVARFQDMTIDQFREIRAKAGGLVIRLPEDTAQLSLEEKQVG